MILVWCEQFVSNVARAAASGDLQTTGAVWRGEAADAELGSIRHQSRFANNNEINETVGYPHNSPGRARAGCAEVWAANVFYSGLSGHILAENG